MSRVDKALSETFGVPPIYEEIEDGSQNRSIIPFDDADTDMEDDESEGQLAIQSDTDSTDNDQIDADVEQIRESIKDLITEGKEALQTLMHIAKAEEKIAAFEVAAKYMTSITGMSMQLMRIHEQKKKLKKMDPPQQASETPSQIVNNGGTTNIAFVGNSNDVMKFIKDKGIVLNPEDIVIDDDEDQK
jgi:hypothetical protein